MKDTIVPSPPLPPNKGRPPLSREGNTKAQKRRHQPMLFKETLVISAFPACGKTHCTNNAIDLSILDSDSSIFSWIKGTNKRNPDFPNNYIKHIKENIGKVDVIFVSSHKKVRDALGKNFIYYTLIFPEIELKEEWLDRLGERGSSPEFIKFISDNWDQFIMEMAKERTPDIIMLPYHGKTYIDEDMLKAIDHVHRLY